MTIKEKRAFLESKGITPTRHEGDDYSTVFHVSATDREKATQEKLNWEDGCDCYIEASDMFGMNVIIMENDGD